MRVQRLFLACALVAIVSHLRAQGPTLRDSAGIRIVQNQSRATAPLAFHLVDRPTLEIRGPGPAGFDAGLYPVVVRLSDGRVAVGENVRTTTGMLEPITRVQVDYFDGAGRLLRTTELRNGRSTALSTLTQLCRLTGDSIFGGGTNLLVLLAPDGTIVRFIPVDGSPRGCLADGSMVLVGYDGAHGELYHPQHVWSVATDGRITAEFGTVAASPALIVPGRATIFSGTRMIPQFEEVVPPGRLSRSIRTDDPPDSVTAAQVVAIQNRSRVSGVTYITDVVGMPPVHPAYNEIRTDPAGRIWVQDYAHTADGLTAPGGSAHWTAFDSLGRIIGAVQLPVSTDQDRWEVASIGLDEIVLRHRVNHTSLTLVSFPFRQTSITP